MSEQDTAPPFERAPGAHHDHRYMLVKAWALIGGEYACYCGAPAVVEIRTQPDADPGLVCAKHGLEWLDLISRTATFGAVPPSGALPVSSSRSEHS